MFIADKTQICGGIFVAPAGEISSVGINTLPIHGSLANRCEWAIFIPADHEIKLKFLLMDFLDDDPNCMYNYVQVCLHGFIPRF